MMKNVCAQSKVQMAIDKFSWKAGRIWLLRIHRVEVIWEGLRF